MFWAGSGELGTCRGSVMAGTAFMGCQGWEVLGGGSIRFRGECHSRVGGRGWCLRNGEEGMKLGGMKWHELLSGKRIGGQFGAHWWRLLYVQTALLLIQI